MQANSIQYNTIQDAPKSPPAFPPIEAGTPGRTMLGLRSNVVPAKPFFCQKIIFIDSGMSIENNFSGHYIQYNYFSDNGAL